ncbi:hypothetical protein F4861DRAFT_532402 [Xylaria intraflava]|nr:hypothetical protein F4861DRAFT_532402 [Xylaria intraflava]
MVPSPVDSPAVTPSAPPHRRANACEPCRKRKVACDRGRPFCIRCRQKLQTSDCVYPASRSSRYLSSVAAPPRLAPVGVQSTAATEGIASQNPEQHASRHRTPGYLGSTSFSAVFRETEFSLSELQGLQVTPSTPDSRHQEISAPDEFRLDTRTRDICLFVLRNVPYVSPEKIILRDRTAWHSAFVRRTLKSFYETFGRYFESQRSDASLEELAVLLSKNTALAFSDDDDISPEQWLAQFSGRRARWETLGLLFAFGQLGVTTITRDDHSQAAQDSLNRPSRVTKHCLEFCIHLCQEFCPANSLLLALTFKRMQMETMVDGDMGCRPWLFLAEAVALLTFLGYHVLPNTPDYQYKFMVEVKRKIYFEVHIAHMALVSLTGRPPLMDRRYHTTPLPLNVSDAFLSNDRDSGILRGRDYVGAIESSKPIADLSIAFLRARAQLSLLREEIMRFALSTWCNVSVEELLDVKARESLTIKEFPPFVEYRDSDLDSRNEVMEVLYLKLLMRLEHLLNLFLIERLLLKHGHTQSELLSVSFDIVTYTLPFWTHQITLLRLSGDCEWLLMAYGVPAGGILCQELLKPTLHGDPRITRSSLIQKLSLLVGFLDWVKPTAPNGDLCYKCKTIIQHVLDQALNASATGYESADGAMFDWDFAAHVDFDFDLLNTFDWARAEGPSIQTHHTVPTSLSN